MTKKLTEKEHNQGLNTCDKCGVKMDSESLIWITSEDFTPIESLSSGWEADNTEIEEINE